MGIITDIEHYQSHARRKPYKGPINEPCSACGDGDTAMEYHDHDPLLPSYTLADLERLGREYGDECLVQEDSTIEALVMSHFVRWLAKKEREANVNQKS